jgi:hypothetical protein
MPTISKVQLIPSAEISSQKESLQTNRDSQSIEGERVLEQAKLTLKGHLKSKGKTKIHKAFSNHGYRAKVSVKGEDNPGTIGTHEKKGKRSDLRL